MRSTFPCTFSGRELISSRNSVPPSADSTSPTFPSRLAPVKLLTRWYENLARQLDIPVFFINTCYNPMDCVTETRVRYVRAQIDQLIRDLCAFTGKTWDGIACWPYLSHNLRTLKQYGINMVASSYGKAWAIQYDDLDGMARAYCFASTNGDNASTMLSRRYEALTRMGCEGTIYHVNRSCMVKSCDPEEYDQPWLEKDLRAAGIPCASIEIDQQNAG